LQKLKEKFVDGESYGWVCGRLYFVMTDLHSYSCIFRMPYTKAGYIQFLKGVDKVKVVG
jgi:hypothetical protein